MGDEKWVIPEFKRSAHGKSLTRVADLRKIVNGADWSKPLKGSTNIRIIALGALAHAGKEGLGRLDSMFAADNGWGLGGNEQGSVFYEQGWTAPVIMSFWADDEGARRWSRAKLAEHALSTVPFPNKLRVRVNTEKGVRDLKRWGSYKGPLSILPGPRYIWDWPSRRPSAPEIERGLINPILQYAINASGRKWNQWKHDTLGWPMEALFGIGGSRYGKAQGPLKDPESGAFLESFSKAAARPLVERLNAYPLRPERGVEWRFYAGGSRAISRWRSTHHTRGPCLVTVYSAGKREVLCATASKPRAGGEWWAASASLGDTQWRCKLTADGHEISGPLPSGKLLYSIVWDKSGCRIVGDEVDDDHDDDDHQPRPQDARVTQALGLFSQVAVGSGDPWVKQGIQTAAEVMRRITVKEKAGAIRGSRSLTRVLES